VEATYSSSRPKNSKGDSVLKLFNSLSKSIESFRPVRDDVTTIFTCGPSIYQRAHIGNFRTFLFEDILLRYLEYSGYTVKRGMNFTDLQVPGKHLFQSPEISRFRENLRARSCKMAGQKEAFSSGYLSRNSVEPGRFHPLARVQGGRQGVLGLTHRAG